MLKMTCIGLGLTFFQFVLIFILFKNGFCNDITKEVFGETPPSTYFPAAFGDFNADKLTDVFAIENALNGSYVIRVLLSHSETPLIRDSGPNCVFHVNVKSLVPSDFDGDGAMDILVVSFEEGFYKCYIAWGNLRDLTCPEMKISLATLKSQPLLVDYNGDMISDLFGEGPDGLRSFWVFNTRRSTPFRVIVTDFDPLPELKMSGGHAFVDADGDLAADLWVSAEGRFELWPSINDFKSFDVIEHPKINANDAMVIGQSTFCDLDLDGQMEVLLPICADSSCSQSFMYVYEFTNVSGIWHNLKVNLMDPDEVTWSFPSDKPAFLYTNTITPRVGDINLDGYPDVLITLFNGNTPRVIPLINSECKIDCEYPRTLVPQWDTFKHWGNSVLGTFFDFLEDGTMDVLLVNVSSDGKTYSVNAYKDAIQYDAMFVKVLVLTGVCYNNCPHDSIPYGTNQPGPSITYSMTSADGGIQRAHVTQMSQTSHFALQLPFSMLGLGRNWNFIDKLRVGIPITRTINKNETDASSTVSPPVRPFSSETSTLSVLSKTFTQIIPNSQLVVIPYPQQNPSLWITKLFITPSKAMLLTAGALIATCLFVGAIIGALHIREKQQDKQEKRQQAQSFHFDAM